MLQTDDVSDLPQKVEPTPGWGRVWWSPTWMRYSKTCTVFKKNQQHSERWSSFNIEYKMEELTEQKNWEVEFTKYWNFK